MTAAGSILPDISGIFSLDPSTASSIPLSQFFGGFSGLIILGFLIKRVKPRVILSAAAFTMGISSLCISIIRTFSFGTFAAFYCAGLSMSIMFALPGVIVSNRSGKEGAKNLNILYSFMSIGVVSSPLVSGIFIKSGFHYPATYFIIACAAFIGGTASAFVKQPVAELGEGFTITIFRELLQKHRGVFILVICMSLFYMGSETIPFNWIPEYFKNIFPGYSGFRSRVILSLFGVSLTLGRYICAAILNIWNKPKLLLLILSILGAVCLALVPAGDSHNWAEVMFILTGLFFSGMMPIIFSFTDLLPEKLAGTCFILILTIGMLGASGANKAFGLITAAAGFRVGVVIGAIPALLIFFLVLVMKPEIRLKSVIEKYCFH